MSRYDNRKAISQASNPKLLAWYDNDLLGQTLERYGLTQDAEARTLSEVLTDERSKPADKIRVWRHVRDLRNDAAKARGTFVNIKEERTRVDPATGERIRQIIEARGINADDAERTADDIGFSRQAPASREYVAHHQPARAHTEHGEAYAGAAADADADALATGTPGAPRAGSGEPAEVDGHDDGGPPSEPDVDLA